MRDFAALGRRISLILFAVVAAVHLAADVRGQGADADAWAVLKADGIVLFRHAHAPGGGDPPGMKLGDCATQRNLDAEGRGQALQIGRMLQDRGIAVGRVLASQWCRSRQTAELAFPGRVVEEPAFNSFFDDRSTGPAQTEAARKILQDWRGPGALVVVTHHVNVLALTGQAVTSAEGVIVKLVEGKPVVVGRIRP